MLCERHFEESVISGNGCDSDFDNLSGEMLKNTCTKYMLKHCEKIHFAVCKKIKTNKTW